MTTFEILQRAKQELLTRGWCQGVMQNERGEVCAMGAVFLTDPDQDRCYEALNVFGNIVHTPVPFWNDAPGRTPEQVLALFDAAIARAQRDEVAASVPAAVVDAPESPLRGHQDPTHPDGGDRGKESSSSSSLSTYLDQWITDAQRAVQP